MAQRQFLNRRQAIESAVIEKLERMRQTRLLSALSDLDSFEEMAIAEEGMESELRAWPEYWEATSAWRTSTRSEAGNMPAQRIGRSIGRESPEEVERVVEGLVELIGR